MLWQPYVFRRGNGVQELWDELFSDRPMRILYLAGGGFDLRAQSVLRELRDNVVGQCREIEYAKMLSLTIADYELSDELVEISTRNRECLRELFFGETEEISIASTYDDTEDLGANVVLNRDVARVLDQLDEYTDIILDVSSLPRVVYMALIAGILDRVIPDKDGLGLEQVEVNFQVLVAEDASLDGRIRAEEPSNELILIPGYAAALQVEIAKDWPLVWFPVLGENRSEQLQKVIALAEIDEATEICPILPHPSGRPRRADDLLVEYMVPLFDERHTPITNVLHVDESNPFETYRQLLRAMRQYRESMALLGGCRLVVTPLGSKLVTIGVTLACFEMQGPLDSGYGVAIPHAEPRRYSASRNDLEGSNPEVSCLVLTGESYRKVGRLEVAKVGDRD